MIWLLATGAAAFFLWVARDERQRARDRRCVARAQARLEREIAERGDG